MPRRPTFIVSGLDTREAIARFGTERQTKPSIERRRSISALRFAEASQERGNSEMDSEQRYEKFTSPPQFVQRGNCGFTGSLFTARTASNQTPAEATWTSVAMLRKTGRGGDRAGLACS
jgi:hypothetical protein